MMPAQKDNKMDKKLLRAELQKRVLELSYEERSEKNKKIYQNLINTNEFRNALVIMTYLSLPHEVDTAAAILYAWQHNKTVAVPKVSWQQRHMIPVQINSLETGLSSDVNGLRSPVAGSPIPIEDIDLVITPGLGFDRKGNRLGRGGAYYDRFFADKQLRALKCGLAFSEQIVDSIPTCNHDKAMDFLVDDTQVMYFSHSSEGE